MRIIINIFIIFLFPITSHCELWLTHLIDLELPENVKNFTSYRFIDYDDDGYSDIYLYGSDFSAIYSPVADSLLLFDQNPTSFDSSYKYFPLYIDTILNPIKLYNYHRIGCAPGDFCWDKESIIWKVYNSTYDLLYEKDFDILYSCGYTPFTWEKSIFSAYYIGDIVQDAPRYELVMAISHSALDTDAPSDIACYYSSRELAMYNLSSKDSLIELWSKEWFGNPILIFGDNEYRVVFYIVQDEKIYMVRSTDGMIEDVTVELPYANRYIMGYERIISKYNPQLIYNIDGVLKIYNIDIVLDAGEFPEQLPQTFTILQNYPNPFNPVTKIDLTVPRKGHLKLSVYNIIGQKVDELYNSEIDVGNHTVEWDASHYSSGIYLIKADYNNQIRTIKTVLLK